MPHIKMQMNDNGLTKNIYLSQDWAAKLNLGLDENAQASFVKRLIHYISTRKARLIKMDSRNLEGYFLIKDLTVKMGKIPGENSSKTHYELSYKCVDLLRPNDGSPAGGAIIDMNEPLSKEAASIKIEVTSENLQAFGENQFKNRINQARSLLKDHVAKVGKAAIKENKKTVLHAVHAEWSAEQRKQAEALSLKQDKIKQALKQKAEKQQQSEKAQAAYQQSMGVLNAALTRVSEAREVLKAKQAKKQEQAVEFAIDTTSLPPAMVEAIDNLTQDFERVLASLTGQKEAVKKLMPRSEVINDSSAEQQKWRSEFKITLTESIAAEQNSFSSNIENLARKTESTPRLKLTDTHLSLLIKDSVVSYNNQMQAKEKPKAETSIFDDVISIFNTPQAEKAPISKDKKIPPEMVQGIIENVQNYFAHQRQRVTAVPAQVLRVKDRTGKLDIDYDSFAQTVETNYKAMLTKMQELAKNDANLEIEKMEKIRHTASSHYWRVKLRSQALKKIFREVALEKNVALEHELQAQKRDRVLSTVNEKFEKSMQKLEAAESTLKTIELSKDLETRSKDSLKQPVLIFDPAIRESKKISWRLQFAQALSQMRGAYELGQDIEAEVDASSTLNRLNKAISEHQEDIAKLIVIDEELKTVQPFLNEMRTHLKQAEKQVKKTSEILSGLEELNLQVEKRANRYTLASSLLKNVGAGEIDLKLAELHKLKLKSQQALFSMNNEISAVISYKNTKDDMGSSLQAFAAKSEKYVKEELASQTAHAQQAALQLASELPLLDAQVKLFYALAKALEDVPYFSKLVSGVMNAKVDYVDPRSHKRSVLSVADGIAKVYAEVLNDPTLKVSSGLEKIAQIFAERRAKGGLFRHKEMDEFYKIMQLDLTNPDQIASATSKMEAFIEKRQKHSLQPREPELSSIENLALAKAQEDMLRLMTDIFNNPVFWNQEGRIGEKKKGFFKSKTFKMGGLEVPRAVFEIHEKHLKNANLSVSEKLQHLKKVLKAVENDKSPLGEVANMIQKCDLKVTMDLQKAAHKAAEFKRKQEGVLEEPTLNRKLSQ